MKVNIEVDMTPEELRRFMGLPDVTGIQQQLIDQFAQRVTSSDHQDEFLGKLIAGSMTPWQNFFESLAGTGLAESDPRRR